MSQIVYDDIWNTTSALEIYRRYTWDPDSESLHGFVVKHAGMDADETWDIKDYENEDERITAIGADLRLDAALEAVHFAHAHPKTIVSVDSIFWRMTEVIYDDVVDVMYLIHPEPGEWDTFFMEHYDLYTIGRHLNTDWFNEEP